MRLFIRKKTITRISFKAIYLTLMISFLAVIMTTAFLSDQESSLGNTFATGTLDLEIEKKADDFSPIELLPGQSATQSALWRNAGNLDFLYSQEIANATSSAGLCDNLQLKTWYYYYDSLGILQKSLKYSGLLASFSINTLGTDPEMGILNSYPYFANSDYTDREHWYWYEIILPSGSDPSLGNQTCSFDIVGKAWQEGLSPGVGFWDEEVFSNSVSTGSWAKVSGMKFNDENGNGAKDGGEPGLEDWTIYAAQEQEKFDVNSDGTAETSEVLEIGETYLIRAKGTFSAGDQITADAKYSVRAPNTTWTDSVQNYESYGPELLDLQIDNNSPDWGEYNDSHEYWLTHDGDGTALTFDIYDIYYPNNSGDIEVTIFKIMLEDITDSSGNYELDLSNIDGEVVIAEKPQDS
jgi:hypothetical protein